MKESDILKSSLSQAQKDLELSIQRCEGLSAKHGALEAEFLLLSGTQVMGSSAFQRLLDSHAELAKKCDESTRLLGDIIPQNMDISSLEAQLLTAKTDLQTSAKMIACLTRTPVVDAAVRAELLEQLSALTNNFHA